MIFKTPENEKRLKNIRALFFDVDGVLTDGSIIYGNSSEDIKIFNVKDGLGIRLLMGEGIKVGIVTGRRSGALVHRCNNLGINLLFDGVKNKAALVEPIAEATGVPAEQTAFVGDDLPDIALMRMVGLSIAVADAESAVINAAQAVTLSKGGHGVAREICETILTARGDWEKILDRFK
jgi:3-deoxy-D-manno-octulosonate 8-phosphate phosphatase (KDO 8-P phosphatase)